MKERKRAKAANTNYSHHNYKLKSYAWNIDWTMYDALEPKLLGSQNDHLFKGMVVKFINFGTYQYTKINIYGCVYDWVCNCMCHTWPQVHQGTSFLLGIYKTMLMPKGIVPLGVIGSDNCFLKHFFKSTIII